MDILFSSNPGRGNPRTVSIYAMHTDAVQKMNWEPVYQRMPKRMEKANRYRLEQDRLLCVGAGLLLLEKVGIQKESELRFNEYGRISAPGYPDFNLSHSGEWCVLAMGDAQIGVDIEKNSSGNLQVAPMVLTGKELAWMRENPVERFHILWTMKESVMKATGQGMNLEPGSFEALPFCFHLPIRLQGRSWYAVSGKLGNYCCTVCASYPMKTVFQQIV